MDDFRIDELVREENEQLDKALTAAEVYLTKREKSNLYTLQDIIYSALKSRLANYRIKIIRLKERLKTSNFVDSYKLMSQLAIYKDKKRKIQKVVNFNFNSNYYINGSLSSDYSKLFSSENMASFSLFNEIKEYYKRNTKDDDLDRIKILEHIDLLENAYKVSIKMCALREENKVKKYISIIENAIKEFGISNLEEVFNRFISSLNEKKQLEYEYTNDLLNNHQPQYTNSDVDKMDGFGINASKKATGIIKEKIKNSKGKEDFSDYKINEIYNLLERYQEVNEIKDIVISFRNVLNTKNNRSIDGDNVINYSPAINQCYDFISFCDELISKYESRLNHFKYNELLGKILGLNQVKGLDHSKFKNTIIKNEKIDNENERMIGELGISSEFLDLCTEDLFNFGIICENDINKLSSTDVSKVINHSNNLRMLLGKSEVDKARIRASWPRIEDGKLVIITDPSSYEITNQLFKDRENNLYERVDQLAYDMKAEIQL